MCLPIGNLVLDKKGLAGINKADRSRFLEKLSSGGKPGFVSFRVSLKLTRRIQNAKVYIQYGTKKVCYLPRHLRLKTFEVIVTRMILYLDKAVVPEKKVRSFSLELHKIKG